MGSFLNVHEGPIGIHFRKKALEFPLKECNIVTNGNRHFLQHLIIHHAVEPGYYEDGQFGIRIENTVEVVSVKAEVQLLSSGTSSCMNSIILRTLAFSGSNP